MDNDDGFCDNGICDLCESRADKKLYPHQILGLEKCMFLCFKCIKM